MASQNLATKPKVDNLVGMSAWELFLLGAGIAECNCASLLASRTQEGQAIRKWVCENYTTRYVPEHILEALGLRKQLKRSWQFDERLRTPARATVGTASTGDAVHTLSPIVKRLHEQLRFRTQLSDQGGRSLQ